MTWSPGLPVWYLAIAWPHTFLQQRRRFSTFALVELVTGLVLFSSAGETTMPKRKLQHLEHGEAALVLGTDSNGVIALLEKQSKSRKIAKLPRGAANSSGTGRQPSETTQQQHSSQLGHKQKRADGTGTADKGSNKQQAEQTTQQQHSSVNLDLDDLFAKARKGRKLSSTAPEITQVGTLFPNSQAHSGN